MIQSVFRASYNALSAGMMPGVQYGSMCYRHTLTSSHATPLCRLEHTPFPAAYTLAFQTHLFSILPSSFSRGFKSLCSATLPPPGLIEQATGFDPSIFSQFETLGLLDRYESLIASVGYERIEAHVVETCSGKWTEPILPSLREWMSNSMVPWMLVTYAKGAKNSAKRASCPGTSNDNFLLQRMKQGRCSKA